jgi:TetR/AcrR family transcriptional regulator
MPVRTARQDEIIQESLSLIAEQGLQGLTYRNLSERIGVTVPAFYRHFPSKADILEATVDYLQEVSGDDFDQAEQHGRDALDSLRLILLGYAERFAANQGLAAMVFPDEVGSGDHGLQKRVLAHMEENQKRLKALVVAGVADGLIRPDIPPERWAFIVMGSFRLLVTKWRLDGHTTDLVAGVHTLWRDLDVIIRPPAPAAATV